jgi:hypothetical protein
MAMQLAFYRSIIERVQRLNDKFPAKSRRLIHAGISKNGMVQRRADQQEYPAHFKCARVV